MEPNFEVLKNFDRNFDKNMLNYIPQKKIRIAHIKISKYLTISFIVENVAFYMWPLLGQYLNIKEASISNKCFTENGMLNFGTCLFGI